MSQRVCSSCLKPTGTFKCGLCDESLCKKCAQFLDPDYFSFLDKIPTTLTYSAYCSACLESAVTPEVAKYEQILRKAREMNVFYKGQGREIRTLNIQRSDEILTVADCADYQETVLRLAFKAAEKNYNVIVDVDTHSEKIHDGSYHTLKWSGKAIPCNVDPEKLNIEVDPRFLKYES